MRDTEYLVGFEFHYGCRENALSPTVRSAWQPIGMDDCARQFIEEQFERPHGFWLTRLHRVLSSFASDFDVNGWLNTYPLHLLSTAQWKSLLPSLDRRSTHLDVGAGNGDLTMQLAPLFSKTTTTERSRAMVKRLRARGFECVPQTGREDDTDPLQARRFDVVSCLNVLDRSPLPKTLLARTARWVANGGLLVLSVPLPLQPFYYAGASTLAPDESLGVPDGPWEAQCVALVESFLDAYPHFRLGRVTRCPYISGGDATQRLYVLDALVVVFEHTGASASAK